MWMKIVFHFPEVTYCEELQYNDFQIFLKKLMKKTKKEKYFFYVENFGSFFFLFFKINKTYKKQRKNF